MCAMRLFTEAEEQIEANVQRNDDIDSDDVDKDEDDRDGSIRGGAKIAYVAIRSLHKFM